VRGKREEGFEAARHVRAAVQRKNSDPHGLSGPPHLLMP
jgi:hypothetical protein